MIVQTLSLSSSSSSSLVSVVVILQDGTLNSSAGVEVKVVDVQNSPPAFSAGVSAALAEDAAVGTRALTLRARDQDRAHPRSIHYQLLTSMSSDMSHLIP